MRAVILAVLSLVLCLLVLAPTPGHAQQPQPQKACGERTKIIEHIAKKYKEVPRAMAITGANTFLEIFVSPSGTWTTLITDVTGKTCLVASGEGWEDIAIKPAGTAI